MIIWFVFTWSMTPFHLLVAIYYDKGLEWITAFKRLGNDRISEKIITR